MTTVKFTNTTNNATFQQEYQFNPCWGQAADLCIQMNTEDADADWDFEEVIENENLALPADFICSE